VNKKVFILGASSDIGREVVKQFLKNNWHVTAHYNSSSRKLKNIKSNHNLELFKFDLKKIKNFEKFTNKNKKFFSFDSFVSLTGYQKIKSFNKTTVKDIYDHINCNYLANFIIIKSILKKMDKKKWGRILLSSSIGTKFGGGSYTFAYSMSKFLNEFFPTEYKKYYKNNILINSLQIGLTDTKIHKKNKTKNLNERIRLIPIKRMAKTYEVANYIYFLCSAENQLITNEVINISGGE
jgi:3-oxoacyl-[acyl-carrier protein] reductase